MDLRKEVPLGRTEMSQRELGRVEVLARVRHHQRRVVDAATLLRVSYRHAKRLWKRYREQGAAGLKHRSAGRPSNRSRPEGFRRKVLRRGGGEVRQGRRGARRAPRGRTGGWGRSLWI